MYHDQTSFVICRILAAAACLAAVANAHAASEGLDARCVPQLGGMDQKLYEKGHESTTALRQFIWIRRGFLSVDVAEAAERVARIDSARSACLESQASVGGTSASGR